MTVALHHGDCREIIPTLGVTVDAVVTDPPYHLQNIADRAARPFNAKGGLQKNGAMARLAAGFMGQQWDGGDITFRPETWATIGTVLRPGGFLLAFGGTRTYHRLACAIEDAGFVIQDCLMWLFATGFPKRRDMLKPAYEPIVLAYKPGGKRSLQVDECRIVTAENLNGGAYSSSPSDALTSGMLHSGIGGGILHNGIGEYEQPAGRWPANICHDGSDEVVALFPESGGAFADVKGDEPSNSARYIYSGLAGRHPPRSARGDSGSAARFFFSAKADAQDRWGSRHPTVKPVELMKWLVALVTPVGGTVLDPFAGSGTTAAAAMATGRSAILIEREDAYIADIRERLAFYEGTGMHSMQAKNRNRGNGVGALRDGGGGRPVPDHGPLFNTSTDGGQPAQVQARNTDESITIADALNAVGSRI